MQSVQVPFYERGWKCIQQIASNRTQGTVNRQYNQTLLDHIDKIAIGVFCFLLVFFRFSNTLGGFAVGNAFGAVCLHNDLRPSHESVEKIQRAWNEKWVRTALFISGIILFYFNPDLTSILSSTAAGGITGKYTYKEGVNLYKKIKDSGMIKPY